MMEHYAFNEESVIVLVAAALGVGTIVCHTIWFFWKKIKGRLLKKNRRLRRELKDKRALALNLPPLGGRTISLKEARENYQKARKTNTNPGE